MNNLLMFEAFRLESAELAFRLPQSPAIHTLDQTENWENSMKIIAGLLLASCFVFVSHAYARDTRQMYSIADALKSASADKRIDKNVKMYFGNQPHAPVAANLGTYTSNKKTNAFNKSDKVACEWAFLSAILSFQDRVAREGGNAVINLHSYYKKQEISSSTEYMCGAGTFVAGVAFRGDVVKLK